MNDETATNGTSAACGASDVERGVRRGSVERELETAFGLASFRGDEDAIAEAKSELAQLREENERLYRYAAKYSADAKRYRFLRDGNKRWDGVRSNDEHLYGDELDAAIDAAMNMPNQS